LIVEERENPENIIYEVLKNDDGSKTGRKTPENNPKTTRKRDEKRPKTGRKRVDNRIRFAPNLQVKEKLIQIRKDLGRNGVTQYINSCIMNDMKE
jgi:hypothetical protein